MARLHIVANTNDGSRGERLRVPDELEAALRAHLGQPLTVELLDRLSESKDEWLPNDSPEIVGLVGSYEVFVPKAEARAAFFEALRERLTRHLREGERLTLEAL